MKKLILLAVLAIALTAAPVFAGPVIWSIDPDSGRVLSGVSAADSNMYSPTFKMIENPDYIFFGAIVTDTGAGNGALTDSFIVALQKYVDLSGITPLWKDSVGTGWVTVQALPAIDPTKNAGKQHFIPADSLDLAYEVGGLMRFEFYKGGGQAKDTINGNYTIKAFLECWGKD